jgi:hypothetical protein
MKANRHHLVTGARRVREDRNFHRERDVTRGTGDIPYHPGTLTDVPADVPFEPPMQNDIQAPAYSPASVYNNQNLINDWQSPDGEGMEWGDNESEALDAMWADGVLLHNDTMLLFHGGVEIIRYGTPEFNERYLVRENQASGSVIHNRTLRRRNDPSSYTRGYTLITNQT